MLPLLARRSRDGCVLFALLLFVGCRAGRPLMPTPALHEGQPGLLDATDPTERTQTVEVFFATDRRYEPERVPDPYPPERERFLRLGHAHARIGPKDLAWEDVATLSSSRHRNPALTIELAEVEDYGPHAETTVYFDPILQDPDVQEPARRYAALINERLASARRREICIYVSQFNAGFDIAVMAAAELQHYLCRDAVFIAYSWPSEERTLSYPSANENAYRTRRMLRIFIEYLARETSAERINIMSYSSGARVLSGVLHELALDHSHLSTEEVRQKLRLGQIVFCAGDIDRGAFFEHAADGTYRLAENMTIYTNPYDEVLGFSRTLFKWERLGQVTFGDLTPSAIGALLELDHVAFVDVSNARQSRKEGGHGYYRLSPHVSSDVLLSLGLGLAPAERGLVRRPGDPIWCFPDDYEERLARIRSRMPISAGSQAERETGMPESVLGP